jgi:adenylate cyclase
MSLFNELKRRNVFKATVGYIITGWLVMQIADVVLNNIEAPDWIFQVLMLFLGLGLPMVIVFAWAFELTPEGIKRESEIDRSQSIATETGKKLNGMIMTVLVLGLGYFAYDKFFVSADREAALVEAATQAAVEQSAEVIEAEIDRSIAVLPFADMSPNQDQEYFTDGLSEELLNLLAKIPEIKVASRSSSFQFKDKGVDILEAAKQLNVAHILEGSVRKDGNQLRITAQLIKADDGFHIWSETYDRELKGVFAIQDEISSAVVDALKVTLLGTAPKSRETNPEAYASYLQGTYFYNLRSEEHHNKAVAAYQAALAIDPEYAPALAGLSEVYLEQADFGYINSIEGMVLSRSMAERAISLDPSSADAWQSLSRIRWGYDWNWEGAAEADRKALQLEPGNVSVITQSARLASSYGDLETTIRLNRQATELDPLSLRPLSNLALSFRDAGMLDQAETTYRKLLTLNPDYAGSHQALATTLLLAGRPEEALKEAELETSRIWKSFAMALVHAVSEDEGKGSDHLEAFIRDFGGVGAFQVATIYARRSEADLAFEWLERAYSQRDGGLTGLLTDAFLAILHDDARWEPFLEKMNLLEYWHAKKEREAAAVL